MRLFVRRFDRCRLPTVASFGQHTAYRRNIINLTSEIALAAVTYTKSQQNSTLTAAPYTKTTTKLYPCRRTLCKKHKKLPLTAATYTKPNPIFTTATPKKSHSKRKVFVKGEQPLSRFANRETLLAVRKRRNACLQRALRQKINCIEKIYLW